jgi:hypothetical protein
MGDGNEEKSSTKEEDSRQEEVGQGRGDGPHGNCRERFWTAILSSECAQNDAGKEVIDK